jgi:CheY-like chemotaxis protein
VLYPLSYGGPRVFRLSARDRALVSPTVTGTTRSQPEPPAVRVLVADDDDVIRRLITVNLELEGYDVVQASDGQGCLDAIRDSHPRVIVIDRSMPQIDGLAVTAALRADPATSGIGVVMVSAKAQQSDVRRGLEGGVDVYLTKPFDPEVLIRAVRSLADDASRAPR